MSDDQAECRVCFCTGGDLIAPCACRGDRMWVHRSTCLDEWRKSSEDNYLVCEVCLYTYQFEATPLYTEKAERRMTLKWYAVIVADTLFALAMIMLLAAFVGSIVYDTDPGQSTSTLVFGEGVLKPVVAYFLIGGFWLCVGIGVIGLLFICCGLSDVKRPRHRYAYGNVYGPDPCCPTVYVCPRCEDDCKGDCCKGGNNNDCGVFFVFIAILAVIGLLLGMYVFYRYVSERVESHARAIWRSDAVRTQRVKHLDVRPAPLRTTPSMRDDLEMGTSHAPKHSRMVQSTFPHEEAGTLLMPVPSAPRSDD